MSLPALAALLFCSGLSGLVFETLWVKMAPVVGVDVYAVTAVVSAFFAGLALGSAVFGRRADRTATPLALYAGLEAGVAVLGAGVTLALGGGLATLGHGGAAAWLLPVFLMAAPAFLMGGARCPPRCGPRHPRRNGSRPSRVGSTPPTRQAAWQER